MERNLDNIARAIIAFRAMLLVQSGKKITAEHKFELGRSLHAFDRNVLVIVGNPTWASGGAARGQQSAPAKTLLEAMAKRWCVFVVHEYNTSQCCPDCGAKMVRTRGWSVRHWRCPEAGGTMTKSARDAKQRHSAEQNKDVTAARCMLRIGLMLLLTGKRPAQFCSPRQLLDARYGMIEHITTQPAADQAPQPVDKNVAEASTSKKRSTPTASSSSTATSNKKSKRTVPSRKRKMRDKDDDDSEYNDKM
jgi:hypothetical protein